MDRFHFTLGTLERGCVGWDIDQKILFRSTKKQKDRKYRRGPETLRIQLRGTDLRYWISIMFDE